MSEVNKPKLTDIKYRIDQLDGGKFQELCDAYLYKQGYKNIFQLGMKSGTHKTTKGTPDTYFTTIDSKYILVMYTAQKAGNLFTKIAHDIKDCFNKDKTGLDDSDIAEIIYCHTSSSLTAGQDKELHTFCSDRGVLLRMFGIDQIANDIYDKYHIIARDFLAISISTEQILSEDEFVQNYNANALAAPLDTKFQFREKDIETILTALEKSNIVIINGQAGVGKTRLALECSHKYLHLHGGQFYCIRSNGLPMYEDLKAFFGVPDKYLLLIDDANQITGLQHIIQYSVKQSVGYDVKIIITVREYAKNDVIQKVREIDIPQLIQIGVFSDNEIEELVKTNLGILNQVYLDKIIHIAEGNARIAMLAGKLAWEANRLDVINDASQLYVDYYGRYLEDNHVLKTDRKMCATAGIIAFLGSMHLEHLDALTPIFNSIKLSSEEFKANIKILHDLEIVDICNDKAVRFSEQCLSNYLIKYVFMDLKVIPFEFMTKTCFYVHRQRVINAVNILGSVFKSDAMNNAIMKSLKRVWDDLKSSNNPNFYEFVKTFHQINPVETLIMMKERIEAEDSVEFDISKIDFEKKDSHQSINNDIINILGGYAILNELPAALDLFFIYLEKRPDLHLEFYFSILQYFGISKDSERYDYNTQKQLIQKLHKHSNGWTDHVICSLFIHVAKELLKLVFTPIEAGRNNTVIYYTVTLQFTEGSKKYRELLWNGLLKLSVNPLYHDKVKNVLEDYGRVSIDKINYDIIQYDYEYMAQLFITAYSPNDLNDCITVYHILQNIERLRVNINLDLDIEPYLNNHRIKIYLLLEGKKQLEEFDYENEKALKKEDISKYVNQCDLSEIKEIINTCMLINANNSRDAYVLSEGLLQVFIELEDSTDIYLTVIDHYISSNTPLNLHPDRLVQTLFNILPETQVYDLLTKYDYAMRNAWIFAYFYYLPESQITEQYIEKLYEFFLTKEGEIKSSLYYRCLDFLSKYEKHDANVFIKCCEIIISKIDYSPFIITIYFGLLFHSYSNNPNDVISKFERHYDLLADIYMNTLSADEHIDYDGDFLWAIYTVHPAILESYIKNMIEEERCHDFHDNHRLTGLWKDNDYLDIMDMSVQYLYDNENELYWFQTSKYLEILLSHEQNVDDIVSRQDQWLSHYINSYFHDENRMYVLFNVISTFAPERRKQHILYFSKVNPSFDAFKKIPLEESSWGGMGSMIPYMETRLTFLETLIPHYSGLQYLQHKQKILNDIESWKRRIEAEQVDEMLRG